MNINEDLKAYLDGELDVIRADEVRLAIEASPDYQQEVEMLKKITHSFQSLKDATVPTQTESMITVLGPVSVPKKMPKKRKNWLLVPVGAVGVILFVAAIFPVFTQAKQASKKTEAMSAEYRARIAGESAGATSTPSADADMAKVETSRPGPANEADMRYRSKAAPPSGSETAPPLDLNRDIIRNGALGIKVEKVAEASIGAVNIAKGLGGYVENSNFDSSNSYSSTATVTLRVPSKQFDAAMVKLRGLGEILSESTSGEDVTGQVVDAEARLKTLRAQEYSYIEILKTTRRTGEVLAVRDRLYSVRQEIEQITAQRDSLKRMSSMSTITTTFVQKVVLEDESKSDKGWGSETFASAVNGLKAVGQFIGQMLIFVFVYSPIWIPLAGIAFWINRRSKRTDD
ncbi:MAG: DUF4349 domain-containing protein [Armatimonadetes bacterium]|nr:DUF4349 domain-containing protein [Armatimonadota bacterium]